MRSQVVGTGRGTGKQPEVSWPLAELGGEVVALGADGVACARPAERPTPFRAPGGRAPTRRAPTRPSTYATEHLPG